MLEQFAREFMQLYPNAKLLVASKDDFTKERRKILTAKIATGDWDGDHRHPFELRADRHDRRSIQERFLREQIAEYEALLIDKASSGRNIIKTWKSRRPTARSG